MNKHERSYNVCLMVLAFLLLLGAISQWGIMQMPTSVPEVRAVFKMVIAIEALYLAAIAAVLTIRLAAPDKSQLLTTALNVVLLLYVPFGTAIGIYGLWKLRPRAEEEAGFDVVTASPPPLPEAKHVRGASVDPINTTRHSP